MKREIRRSKEHKEIQFPRETEKESGGSEEKKGRYFPRIKIITSVSSLTE